MPKMFNAELESAEMFLVRCTKHISVEQIQSQTINKVETKVNYNINTCNLNFKVNIQMRCTIMNQKLMYDLVNTDRKLTKS